MVPKKDFYCSYLVTANKLDILSLSDIITLQSWNVRGRNVPDCLPVSSDRQNVFSPVSTNIQLEQYYFNIILFSLFETQLGLYDH